MNNWHESEHFADENKMENNKRWCLCTKLFTHHFYFAKQIMFFSKSLNLSTYIECQRLVRILLNKVLVAWLLLLSLTHASKVCRARVLLFSTHAPKFKVIWRRFFHSFSMLTFHIYLSCSCKWKMMKNSVKERRTSVNICFTLLN